MAFSATFRDGVANIPSGVTSSFTPAANSTLLCFGGASFTETGDPTGKITVSGGGLTWTLRHIHWRTQGSRVAAIGLWSAQVGGSPSSMAVTVSGSPNNDGAVAVVVELSADDVIGFRALGQADRGNASGSLSFDLDQAPLATSRVYSAVYVKGAGENATLAVGTGWTEVWERFGATGETGGSGSLTQAIQSRDGSTSATVLWDEVAASGSDVAAGLIAVEITEGEEDEGPEPITGTMAAQESGADTFAGSGTVGAPEPEPEAPPARRHGGGGGSSTRRRGPAVTAQYVGSSDDDEEEAPPDYIATTADIPDVLAEPAKPKREPKPEAVAAVAEAMKPKAKPKEPKPDDLSELEADFVAFMEQFLDGA